MSITDMNDWPDCAVVGCPNKCCLRLKSKYCWPHTPGTPQEALENLMATEFGHEPEDWTAATVPATENRDQIVTKWGPNQDQWRPTEKIGKKNP